MATTLSNTTTTSSTSSITNSLNIIDAVRSSTRTELNVIGAESARAIQYNNNNNNNNNQNHNCGSVAKTELNEPPQQKQTKEYQIYNTNNYNNKQYHHHQQQQLPLIALPSLSPSSSSSSYSANAGIPQRCHNAATNDVGINNSIATLAEITQTIITNTTTAAATTLSTSLATLNGNSNLSATNGNSNNNNNNNNNNSTNNIINTSHGGNGNSNISTTTTNNNNASLNLISTTNKMNDSKKTNTSTIAVTTKVDQMPSVTAVNSVTETTTATASGINMVVTTSAFVKPQHQQQQQQQQLHSSREDVTSLGGSSSITSQLSSNLNNNNNNNNYNNNNSNSNSGTLSINTTVHNHPNGILKGSKENLLQNEYCNGSVGGSSRTVNGSDMFQRTDGAITGSNVQIAEQDDPEDGLGPLPSKWETAYTERGELYFIDHNTGTSHWLDPRLSKFQKKSLEECSEDELPYGWEKIEDSLYGTYYIDHINRKTQYENPVLEAKRRAAEQRQKYHSQHQMPPPPNTANCQPRPQTPSSQSILNGAGASIALSSVSSASTLSTIDISQRAMQPPPPFSSSGGEHQRCGAHQPTLLPYRFTRNPHDMQGERIITTLLKSSRGLGITIVGGDDKLEEFLQVKSIVPNGPAWLDGKLQTGDVLVYVNDTCVLGFTHHEMVNVFQSIMPGETVTLEVCRGYPLPFDPNDPNTEVVTTIAVDGLNSEPDKQRRLLMDHNFNMKSNYDFLNDPNNVNKNSGIAAEATSNKLNLNLSTGHTFDTSGFILMKKPEVRTLSLLKGATGFGFTIADSAFGQKVKKILERACCNELQEGDVLLEINDVVVKNKSHLEVVQILKECSKTEPTLVKIQRCPNTDMPPNSSTATTIIDGPGNVAKLRKNFLGATTGIGNNALFRSKTPTADLYSTMQKENLPIRPKTPLVDTRRACIGTPTDELNEARAVELSGGVNAMTSDMEVAQQRSFADSKLQMAGANKSQSSLTEIEAIHRDVPFMDPHTKMVSSLSERLAGTALQAGEPQSTGHLRTTASGIPNYENHSDYVSTGSGNYSSIYGLAQMPPTMSPLSGGLYGPPPPSLGLNSSNTIANTIPYHRHHHNYHESCFCYECQDFRNNRLREGMRPQQQMHASFHPQSFTKVNYYAGHQPSMPGTAGLHNHSQYSPASSVSLQAAHLQNERMAKRVNEFLSDRRCSGFSPLEQTGYSYGNMTFDYLTTPSSQQQQQQQQLQQQQQSVLHSQHSQHSPAVSTISQQQQYPRGNWHTMSNYNILQNPTPAPLSLTRNNDSVDIIDGSDEQYVLSEVTLHRQALGFGFRIVGGTEEGSQVTVGHIVPNGAADNDHRITTGDEILSIDGINVVNASHHKVVSLMGEAALRGQVTMILRRRAAHIPHVGSVYQQHSLALPELPLSQSPVTCEELNVDYPYDVIVTRHENEGFGFVIISSSNQYYGSTIGKLIPGSPADRCCKLKVGDRIVAVNRIDIAGMTHGDVVNLIKESGLHVRLTIGCPKEGAIINAAPTMPAGSGNGSLIDPPSSHLSQQAGALSVDNDFRISGYFDPPLLCAETSAASGPPATQIPHTQPSPSPLSIAPPAQL